MLRKLIVTAAIAALLLLGLLVTGAAYMLKKSGKPEFLLILDSDQPGAEVYLDGKHVGKTPVELDLATLTQVGPPTGSNMVQSVPTVTELTADGTYDSYLPLYGHRVQMRHGDRISLGKYTEVSMNETVGPLSHSRQLTIRLSLEPTNSELADDPQCERMWTETVSVPQP